MARVNAKRRKLQIKIKHKRKGKLAKLRQAYSVVKSEGEKKTIWTKVKKLSPRLSQEGFLSSVKASPAVKVEKKP